MTNGLSAIGFVLLAHEAYLATALWSSTVVGDQGSDVTMDRVYDSEDIHPESVLLTLRDVVDFVSDNLELIGETPDYRGGQLAESARSIGRDLWLTRNGHGAGFWDRGLGDLGERLTTAAQAMGESDLYVGDDGRVHAS